MPAFSATDAFKEAAGYNREMGAWSFQQYKDWLYKANESGAISDRLRQQLEAYAQEQIQQGFASPEDIRAVADQIMPGLEAAIQRRQGRLDSLQDLFNARTMPADTLNRINESIQGQASDIVRTGDQQQTEIEDLYGRQQGINEGTSRDVVQNIGQTAGSIQGGINDTFGGLRGQNAASRDRIIQAIGDVNRTSSGANRDVTAGLLRSGEGAFDEMGQRRDAGYGKLRSDLGQTIGGLERGSTGTTDDIIARAGSTYSGARSKTGDVFGGLKGSAGETYDTAIADAGSLRPTSEAQVARVARSFAPAVSAAAGRLRKRGITSGDAQYDAVMREVEADRARAMDDSAAASGERAVDRINQLRIDKQGAAERLGVGGLDRDTDLAIKEQESYAGEKGALRDILNNLGLKKYAESKDLGLSEMSDAERQLLNREAMRQGLNLGQLERQISLDESRLRAGTAAEEGALGREIDLGVGQSDRVTSIGNQAGRDYRGELIRTAGEAGRNQAVRSGASMDLTDQQFDRTQAWRNKDQQAALLERAIQGEDFDTAARIATMLNGEEITANDMRQQHYENGQDWVINNYTRRDAGAANIGNIYAREGQQQNTAANIARGFGSDATANYGQTYQQEAGRGGWGTRLAVGLGAAGLNLVAPGLGTAVGGVANSALGGTSAMGGAPRGAYGQSGSGGAGGANPYDFAWVMPTYRSGQTQQANQRIGQAGVNQLAGYGLGGPPVTPPFVAPPPRVGLPQNW